ncbi:MAG: OmpH family outer membrane protein [Sporomusaceae bacterium]|nr:OmpH family outer membrane protein [Sporomusaceae bacterium]
MSYRIFFIIMLVSAIGIAGCSTKQPDTKAPDRAQIGIVNMNKAVKAHPKHSQLAELSKQADTLAAQLEAQQFAIQQAQAFQPGSNMLQTQMTELSKASEQEFNAKMSVKQDELNMRISTKVDAIRRTLSDEMKTYNDQIEKEYQPQIFNLQLKLKTLQMTKEEAASIQAELDNLQAKRSAALAAKQAELAARMDELTAPERAASEQQLAAYAKELGDEISRQAGAKQAELAARGNEQNNTAGQTSGELPQQLNSKRQEIEALQRFIIGNIKDKTAKIAVEKGYEAVLTNVAVNVSAVDITDAVIAEFNK